MRLSAALLLFLIFLTNVSPAQNIKSPGYDSSSTRNITWRQIKLSFDDDYLNFWGKGTDQYYTGGWQVDAMYYRNTRKTSLADALLIQLHNARNLYFYGISRKIYTPINTTSAQIVEGDRPYASVLTIQHGLISSNSNEYLATEVGIGAIGPMTYGAQIQKWFHRLINDDIPQGWDYQIHNAIALDYRLNYEKLVYRVMDKLKFLANADCEAGTLVDNIGIGATVAFGKLNNIYVRDNIRISDSDSNTGKLQIHFYMHPTIRMVAFNATLQGGVLSSKSPYVIDKNDINNLYGQFDFGIVMAYRGVGLSLSQKIRTAEFTTGKEQQVGNITLTIPL